MPQYNGVFIQEITASGDHVVINYVKGHNNPKWFHILNIPREMFSAELYNESTGSGDRDVVELKDGAASIFKLPSDSFPLCVQGSNIEAGNIRQFLEKLKSTVLLSL